MLIRRSFLTQEERVSPLRELRCSEIVPGCPHVIRGETEMQVVQEAQRHAREAHGITDITAALRAALLRAMGER